jgi:hypothetical protein
MYRIEIIANHSVEENILDAFSQEEVGKYYTKYANVFGVGNSGPRMGDAVWPEENFSLIVWCEEEEARGIARAVAAVKKQFPDEGIRVFGIPAEPNRFSHAVEHTRIQPAVHIEGGSAIRISSPAPAPAQPVSPPQPAAPPPPVQPPAQPEPAVRIAAVPAQPVQAVQPEPAVRIAAVQPPPVQAPEVQLVQAPPPQSPAPGVPAYQPPVQPAVPASQAAPQPAAPPGPLPAARQAQPAAVQPPQIPAAGAAVPPWAGPSAPPPYASLNIGRTAPPPLVHPPADPPPSSAEEDPDLLIGKEYDGQNMET